MLKKSINFSGLIAVTACLLIIHKVVAKEPPFRVNEFGMTPALADQVSQAISGRTVVLSDKRNGNWRVYGMNLDTGVQFRISEGT